MAASRVAISTGPKKGLSAIPVRHAPCAATETLAKGAAIITDANGRVTEAGVNPTEITGFAIHALAAAAVGTDLAYVPGAGSNVVFEGSVDNTHAGTGTIAQTDYQAEYGLTADTTGIWYVDKDKTGANARVRIVGFKDALATVMGRVYFEVLP